MDILNSSFLWGWGETRRWVSIMEKETNSICVFCFGLKSCEFHFFSFSYEKKGRGIHLTKTPNFRVENLIDSKNKLLKENINSKSNLGQNNLKVKFITHNCELLCGCSQKNLPISTSARKIIKTKGKTFLS